MVILSTTAATVVIITRRIPIADQPAIKMRTVREERVGTAPAATTTTGITRGPRTAVLAGLALVTGRGPRSVILVGLALATHRGPRSVQVTSILQDRRRQLSMQRAGVMLVVLREKAVPVAQVPVVADSAGATAAVAAEAAGQSGTSGSALSIATSASEQVS